MKVKTKSCSIALVSEFLIFLILISSTASASTVLNSPSNGSFAYITNETNDNVSVIDTATNTVTANVTAIVEWQKSLGSAGNEVAASVCQTSDGGYIVAGYSDSNSIDVTENYGSLDYWVVKLDANGNIVWQKCLGGSSGDGAYSIQQTFDGGYIVAGGSDSNDGDVTGNHGVGYSSDYWVVKLDANGNIAWQKCLGGSSYDYAHSIQQTFDGGYIVAGYSSSTNGDVTGNHGNEDYWVVKLDANGNIVWQKSLGGSWYDWAYSIQQTFDGGYIVAGYSSSTDGDVTGNDGHNTWVVKLDASGNIVWQKCLLDSDGAYSIQQTSDSGYIVAGYVQNDYSLTKISLHALVSNFSAIPVSGLAPLKVGFTDQSVGSPTSWSWDFGDGTKSTEQNPMHTYSVAGDYTVNLTAINGTVSSDVKSMNIKVNRAPTPPVTNFTVKQTEALTIQFNDTSSNSPDEWNWEFGDGSTSTDANPTHTYAAAKTYAVNLTVSNAGGSDAVSKKITVTKTTGKPEAKFKVTPMFGRAPLTVKLTDKSVNATSIQWNFGDGATSTKSNPIHTYKSSGFYNAKLTATNNGKSSVASKTIYVVR